MAQLTHSSRFPRAGFLQTGTVRRHSCNHLHRSGAARYTRFRMTSVFKWQRRLRYFRCAAD